MTADLDSLSVLALYSAMAVYALAFVGFAIDLARRSSPPLVDQATSHSATLNMSARVGTAPTLTLPPQTTTETGATKPPARSTAARVATSLTVLAWTLQIGATALRGVVAERLPWANMYEFSLTGTVVIVGVYLGLLTRIDLRYLGTFITGLTLVLLGISTVQYYVPVSPLPPALQSYWLVIHVFVAIVATGFFAIGFALSFIQLASARQRETTAIKRLATLLQSLPTAEKLENLAYRVNIIGFILWTFTLIAGAIWAERAWGRYWGWDTKEVWTFIIWVLYAGYIHARATAGWRGSRSAWLGIVGFAAVLFNFGIVNVFFTGLHSYSGL